MRISTQNITCSQRQMNTCHTSFSYILWACGEHIMSKWSSRTSDHFIWLVSEKKTEAVKAYLIKNSKGEGGGRGKKRKERKKKKNGGRGLVGRRSEGLGGVVWVYKMGLKWPVIAMAITPKPQSVSLSLAVLCHKPSYVTSRCARSLRLKELRDWQDLTVRGRLFHR